MSPKRDWRKPVVQPSDGPGPVQALGERRQGGRRAAGRLRLRSTTVTGRLLNLGPGGFGLETERGLRIGEYYAFSIRREPGGLAPRGAEFSGRVRWCALRWTVRESESEVRPVFWAGFEWRIAPKEISQRKAKEPHFIDFSSPST